MRHTGSPAARTAPREWSERWPRVALFTGGAAYAWFAAGSRPFTTGGDALTAGAFALMVVLVAAARAGAGIPAVSRPGPGEGRLLAWIVAVICVVGWELVTLVARNGHLFPTASDLYNAVASSRLAKSGVFYLWLLLGWGLFGR
ncbi:MAG TPA: hypothetical protein VFN50_02910 [Acidimicrobiales bacterium]|nr:hypothetical protein [Acidimicrobiales bacterium]